MIGIYNIKNKKDGPISLATWILAQKFIYYIGLIFWEKRYYTSRAA